MGFEFLVTLLALALALWKRSDALVITLFGAWLLSLSVAYVAPVELLPGFASIVDVGIAIIAYCLWSVYASQRARLVGMISLLKLVAHFGISANFGDGDWYIYALLVNSCFVMQCVVAGGWFYGMVDLLNRISPRYPDRPLSADKKRDP